MDSDDAADACTTTEGAMRSSKRVRTAVAAEPAELEQKSLSEQSTTGVAKRPRLTKQEKEPVTHSALPVCRLAFFYLLMTWPLCSNIKKPSWGDVDTRFDQLSVRQVDWRGRGVPKTKTEITPAG